MRLGRLALVTALWVVGGCRGTAVPSISAGGAAPRNGPETVARDSDTDKGARLDAGLIGAATSGTPDPLRDPRERHLRHLRQLTRSRRVAMPRFSADGRWIYFAEKHGKEIVLSRVNLTEGSPTIEPLPFLQSVGSPWGLVAGRGAACAVLTRNGCGDDGWPESQALRTCDQMTLAALPAEPATACPTLPSGPLPCATAMGKEVCPRPVDGGIQLFLLTSNAASPQALAPTSGSSWMPALSPNGARLVFVTQPAEGASHLMMSFLDRPQTPAEPIGPETKRTLDPTFTSAGDRVVFASTADDASGQELDLLMIAVIGSSLERITFAPGVDRFPTFSPNGREIAWVSERDADSGAQDLLIADWVSDP